MVFCGWMSGVVWMDEWCCVDGGVVLCGWMSGVVWMDEWCCVDG